ncbi:MAG: hypothetical protein C4297_08545 [Gemmataceae bacterium]
MAAHKVVALAKAAPAGRSKNSRTTESILRQAERHLKMDATLDRTKSYGFITVLKESSSFLGGYLITNHWGRPLEFRLTTWVQPQRIHQILYGPTLETYVCSEVIGRALIDRAGIQPHLILTDCPAVVHVRLFCSVPVGLSVELAGEGLSLPTCLTCAGPLFYHPQFPSDGASIANLLEQCEMRDLREPFRRVQEALSLACKMGATGHA